MKAYFHDSIFTLYFLLERNRQIYYCILVLSIDLTLILPLIFNCSIILIVFLSSFMSKSCHVVFGEFVVLFWFFWFVFFLLSYS